MTTSAKKDIEMKETKIEYRNGNVYEGEVQDGQAHGKGMLKIDHRQYFKGLFKNGLHVVGEAQVDYLIPNEEVQQYQWPAIERLASWPRDANSKEVRRSQNLFSRAVRKREAYYG